MAEKRFGVTDTPMSGLKLVQRLRVEDERGFLSRLYCSEEFDAAGLADSVCQINHTLTRTRGAVRGMHFQRPPHAEDKFVSCLRGTIFDVAVDLREGSPTFLKWYGAELSADNGISLFIPKGFAHGFQTLSGDCELLYLHTASYNRESEGGVGAFDPALAIDWPLPVTEMSARDRNHPPIDEDFAGILL